jgi:hypothetical protein
MRAPLEHAGSETACGGCGKLVLVPPLAAEEVLPEPMIDVPSAPAEEDLLDAEPVLELIIEPMPAASPFDFDKAHADVPDDDADSLDGKRTRFGAPPPIDSKRWEIALLGLKTARLGSQILLGLLVVLFGVALIGRFSLFAWIVVPFLLRPIEVAFAFVFPVGRVLCTYAPLETRLKWPGRLSALFAVLASGTYLAWLLRTLINGVGELIGSRPSMRLSSELFDQARNWVLVLLILSDFWFILFMGRLGQYFRNRGIGGSRLFLFGCIGVILTFGISILAFPVSRIDAASPWYLTVMGLLSIAGIVTLTFQLFAMQDVAIKTAERAASLPRPKGVVGKSGGKEWRD